MKNLIENFWHTIIFEIWLHFHNTIYSKKIEDLALIIARYFRDPIWTFFYRLKRTIKWIKILWANEDWDFAFLMDIIDFKLDLMAKTIKKNNLIDGAEKIYSEIEYVRLLIKQIKTEETIEMSSKWKKFELIYGKFEGFDFEDKNNAIMSFKYSKAKTALQRTMADRRFRELTKEEEAILNKIWEEIWVTISKQARGWWD